MKANSFLKLLVSFPLALLCLAEFATAGQAVSVVQYVNFSCPYSQEIDDKHMHGIQKVVRGTRGSVQVAPFSDLEKGTGLQDRAYWALDTIGREYANNSRSHFYKAKSQNIPLNSRDSVEVFLSEQVTEEVIGLKDVNYDRFFYLAGSSVVIERQKTALDLLSNFSPELLPFFVFVTEEGAVDMVQRRERESMASLASRVKQKVLEISNVETN
mgnify:CR=1 FL=1